MKKHIENAAVSIGHSDEYFEFASKNKRARARKKERKQTGKAGLRKFIVVRDMASRNLLMLPPQINATLDA